MGQTDDQNKRGRRQPFRPWTSWKPHPGSPRSYIDLRKRFGGPIKEDGSDGFQTCENGGATACCAYYTIQALRQLGRHNEADAILFPMQKAFEDEGLQGRGPSGMTYDWTSWDGTPMATRVCSSTDT